MLLLLLMQWRKLSKICIVRMLWLWLLLRVGTRIDAANATARKLLVVGDTVERIGARIRLQVIIVL